MSLARTALRICAVSALKGATNARPTIAENRVYDSRISDFNPETYGDDAKPTVIVLTDSDEGDALSHQNGGPPFHRLIELVIEIGMVQAAQDGADFVVGFPDTDKRLEASLDLLEFQIMRRLSYELDPIPTLFRKFTRIRKHECHRQILDDTGVKIAARILSLTCEVNDDQVIIYNRSATASPAIPTGFDVFPEPLRSVALAMPTGSAELDICNALAAAIAPVTAPPLEGLDVTTTSVPNTDAPLTNLLPSTSMELWARSGASINANAYVGPDGTSFADGMIEDTFGNSHGVTSPDFALTIQDITIWFEAKSAGRWLYVDVSDGVAHFADAWIDLDHLAFGTTTNLTSKSITDLRNGWQLVRMTFAGWTAPTNHLLFNLGPSNGVLTYPGDGASGAIFNRVMVGYGAADDELNITRSTIELP